MKITLDKWKSNEYVDFFNASQDDEIKTNMSDTFPNTLEECKVIVRFFAQSLDKTEYVRAIKVEDKIVGCIAAFFASICIVRTQS